MPIYSIETNQGTFDIEANREPSAEEALALIKGGSKAAPVASIPANQSSGAPYNWNGGNAPSRMNPVTDMPMPAGGAAADMMMRGGGPALGQAMGAPLAPATFGLSVPAGGFAGGTLGEYMAQRRAMQAGEQPGGLQGGRIWGAGVAGLAPAGVGKFLPTAAKYSLTNLAGAELTSRMDQKRDLTAPEVVMNTATGFAGAGFTKFLEKELKSVENALFSARNNAFKAVRKEGVVLPPAEMQRGSDMLTSAAGPKALEREANLTNQGAWNKMARQDLGLSKEALPIMPGDFEEIRRNAADPYVEIKRLSQDAAEKLEKLEKGAYTASSAHGLAVQKADPTNRAMMDPLVTQAKANVDALVIARMKAKDVYDQFKNRQASYQDWQSAQQRVESLNDDIVAAAESLGRPKLVEELNEARKKIAQSYAYESATNPTTGLIDPVDLGNQKWSKVRLTDNAEKIADFANAFRRDAREAGSVLPAGPNNLNQNLGFLAAAGGPGPGMLMAGKNLAMKPMRAGILSNFSQNRLAQDRTVSPSSDFLAQFARFSAQNAGRQ